MTARSAGRRRVLLVVAALAVGGVVWLGTLKMLGPQVPAVRPAAGPVVQTIVTSGRVRPPGRVTMAPLLAGRVKVLSVEEGSEVSAGMPLLELDDAEARTSVEQARARLEEITAQGAGVRTTDARSAAEAVRQAKTRLRDARRTHARIRDLFDQGVASQESLDQINTAEALAESELRAAELQERDIKGTRTARIEAARRQAEAALAAAELRLSQHRLLAPFDGVVIERTLEVGDIVQPGKPGLILVRKGETQLVVEPDERNLALLELGQTALASAEAFPDRSFDAVIEFIAPAVDSRRGTVEVRLAVPEPPDYLKPDMTVSVEVVVGKKDDALLVPTAAVRGLATATPWVLVVDAGRAMRRDVEVGIRGEGGVEITSGLSGQDWVLTDIAGVEPGARVRPEEPAR